MLLDLFQSGVTVSGPVATLLIQAMAGTGEVVSGALAMLTINAPNGMVLGLHEPRGCHLVATAGSRGRDLEICV